MNPEELSKDLKKLIVEMLNDIAYSYTQESRELDRVALYSLYNSKYNEILYEHKDEDAGNSIT